MFSPTCIPSTSARYLRNGKTTGHATIDAEKALGYPLPILKWANTAPIDDPHPT
jgi:hypothetical protein